MRFDGLTAKVDWGWYETRGCAAWQRRPGQAESFTRRKSPMDVDCGRRVWIARDSGSDTPLVPMMESAEPGQGDHLGIAGRPELNGTMRGRLLPETVMGPVIMVEIRL